METFAHVLCLFFNDLELCAKTARLDGLVRPVVRLRVLAAAPAGEAVGRTILRDLDVAETLTTLQE